MQLFPAVGRQRSSVYGAESGEPLPMPLHGFVAGCKFALSEPDPATGGVTATWRSGVDGKDVPEEARWPHDVELSVRVTIEDGNTLAVAYTCSAGATAGSAAVPVSLGNHVSLAVAWDAASSPGVTVAACEAACGPPRPLPLGSDGQVAPPTGEALDGWLAGAEGSAIPLGDDGFAGAVVAFGDPFAPGAAETAAASAPGSDAGELASVTVSGVAGSAAGSGAGLRVTVSSLVPTLATASGEEDTERSLALRRGCCFVFWGRPAEEAGGLGFLCPEPWLGVPDSLNSGIGRALLGPGERLTWGWKLRVNKPREP